MTAQRIEAAKPTKPKGSAEGESLVANGDAPNSLAQKDISMTDTTEQQARATLAAEMNDDHAASTFLAGKDRMISTRVAMRAMHRFASVSSASAEIPTGMKPWAGGDGPPSDWDGGPVLSRSHGMQNVARLNGGRWHRNRPHPFFTPDAEATDIVAYTPTFNPDPTASPAPVPATNQAGEVAAAEAIRSAFFTSVSGEKSHRYHLSLAYPTMEAMHEAEDAIKAWAKSVLDTVSATQPATSQEGRGCEKCQWSGLERFVGYGNSEETLPCSFCSPATTPTLPTATSQEAEADRLREALEEIDRINGGADWNGTRTIARAALARAQVKAS